MIVPLGIIIQNTGMKHIFNDMVDSLSLSVSLSMVCSTADEVSAQTLMQLLPKICHKDSSSIRDNSLRNTMIADNVLDV
jgi:hypothetical protein